MINYQTRAQKLKRMLKMTQQSLSGRQHSGHFIIPQITPIQPPEKQALLNLASLSSSLRSKIEQIHRVADPTLKQIKMLKTKKENIEKLVDVVTSIIQIKRLSYGLGSTPRELYTNIKNFIELKGKVLFCEKHILTIEQQLEKIREEYKKEFDKAIKQSNSENLQEYSRILSLIPDKAETSVRSLEGLVELYCNQMKKDLASIQKDLFDIPIQASTIEEKDDHKFYDLVNNTLKIFVNKLKIYQQNTRKLYGEENVLQLVIGLIETVLNPLLSEIFKRQVRYFSVGKYQKQKKEAKDIKRVKQFVSQYGSIANQIQRFIFYLHENCLKQQSDRQSQNKLQQAVNFASFIEMNTCLIQNSKQLLGLQLDYLYHVDSKFVKIIQHFNKQDKIELEKENVLQTKEFEEFLDNISLIFKRGITRSCKTINAMIALSIIDYQSNMLSSDTVFDIFTQLIDKHINKSTIGSASQLAIIITLNCLSQIPSSLKKQFESIKIPEQLNKIQIQSQLKQLKSSNNKRVKDEIKKHCIKLINLPHFSNLLEYDYKQLINGWNKLNKIAMEIFIQACCDLHSAKLLQSIKKKKMDNVSLLAFEKEVRGIINEYENMSSTLNVYASFRLVMTLISILPIENSEEIRKFTKDLSEKEQEEISNILAERKKL